jgi:hypothetical protein
MRALTAAAMAPAVDMHGPVLLEAMQDTYPIVRYFAANALATHQPALPKPDYLAPTGARDTVLRVWHPLWPAEQTRAAREARERLTLRRTETDVEVGE